MSICPVNDKMVKCQMSTHLSDQGQILDMWHIIFGCQVGNQTAAHQHDYWTLTINQYVHLLLSDLCNFDCLTACGFCFLIYCVVYAWISDIPTLTHDLMQLRCNSKLWYGWRTIVKCLKRDCLWLSWMIAPTLGSHRGLYGTIITILLYVLVHISQYSFSLLFLFCTYTSALYLYVLHQFLVLGNLYDVFRTINIVLKSNQK